MLALGSLYDVLTAQRKPSMGLRYGLNLPCMGSCMSRCRFGPLPFCGIWIYPTKVLPLHTTDSIFVNNFQMDREIWTLKPHPIQIQGSVSVTPAASASSFATLGTGFGHSEVSKATVSFPVSLLASLYLPGDAHCTNVPSVYCTSAPIMSSSALKCVRSPSLGGWGTCRIGSCIQDCVVWNNHPHRFYTHSNFPFYMSGKYL